MAYIHWKLCWYCEVETERKLYKHRSEKFLRMTKQLYSEKCQYMQTRRSRLIDWIVFSRTTMKGNISWHLEVHYCPKGQWLCNYKDMDIEITIGNRNNPYTKRYFENNFKTCMWYCTWIEYSTENVACTQDTELHSVVPMRLLK